MISISSSPDSDSGIGGQWGPGEDDLGLVTGGGSRDVRRRWCCCDAIALGETWTKDAAVAEDVDDDGDGVPDDETFFFFLSFSSSSSSSSSVVDEVRDDAPTFLHESDAELLDGARPAPFALGAAAAEPPALPGCCDEEDGSGEAAFAREPNFLIILFFCCCF